MKKTYGDTILKIKDMKNLKHTHIYANSVSKSNYFRILNQGDLTVSTLLLLIENLGISIQEFFYIHNDYELDVFTRFIDEIHSNGAHYDYEKNMHRFNQKFTETKRFVYERCAHICKILYMIETKNIDNTFIEKMQQSLFLQPEFTYQELILLDLLLPLLPIQFVEQITQKIFVYIEKYATLPLFKTHILFFCFDLIVYFLQHQKTTLAHKLFSEVASLPIPEKYVGVKIYFKFLKTVVYPSDTSETEQTTLLNICKHLELPYLTQKLVQVQASLQP